MISNTRTLLCLVACLLVGAIYCQQSGSNSAKGVRFVHLFYGVPEISILIDGTTWSSGLNYLNFTDYYRLAEGQNFSDLDIQVRIDNLDQSLVSGLTPQELPLTLRIPPSSWLNNTNATSSGEEPTELSIVLLGLDEDKNVDVVGLKDDKTDLGTDSQFRFFNGYKNNNVQVSLEGQPRNYTTNLAYKQVSPWQGTDAGSYPVHIMLLGGPDSGQMLIDGLASIPFGSAVTMLLARSSLNQTGSLEDAQDRLYIQGQNATLLGIVDMIPSPSQSPSPLAEALPISSPSSAPEESTLPSESPFPVESPFPSESPLPETVGMSPSPFPGESPSESLSPSPSPSPEESPFPSASESPLPSESASPLPETAPSESPSPSLALLPPSPSAPAPPPSATASPSPQEVPSESPVAQPVDCGNQLTCGSACYNPADHVCTDSEQVCPIAAPLSCGVACYDTSQFVCLDNATGFLCPASSPNACGRSCFNPSTARCENDTVIPF